MRKLFLFGLILALGLGAGCVHLTIGTDERPTADMALELSKVLAGVPRDWTYVRHVFDCTNMTAYLYDYLTVRGYECEIIGGVNSILGLFKGEGHAWLIAKKDGKKFWIESVAKTIAAQSDYDDYYFFQLRLGSLKTAKILFAIIGFPHEWDY